MIMKKWAIFILFAILLVSAVIILTGEVAVRIAGYHRWKEQGRENILVQPGGRLYQQDPIVGYKPIPGRYEVIYPTHSFNVTHDSSSRRITGPQSDRKDDRPEVWIFGCSFTYGWSLNDEDTYPWILQARKPDVKVQNYGVPGYGNVQALAAFVAALERSPSKPALAIFTYSGFHDERNMFLRSRSKSLASWASFGVLSQPFASLDSKGRVRYQSKELIYRPWPLMKWLATVHFLEVMYNNRIEPFFLRPHDLAKAVVSDMAKRCVEAGIPFAIAFLDKRADTEDMMKYCSSNAIPIIDMRVDYSDPAFMNLPYDPHPNRRANEVYAQRILEYAL